MKRAVLVLPDDSLDLLLLVVCTELELCVEADVVGTVVVYIVVVARVVVRRPVLVVCCEDIELLVV